LLFAILLLTMPERASCIRANRRYIPNPRRAQIEPSYAPVARFPADGTVLLKLNVEADGKVSDAQAWSGPPAPYQTAIESAKQWKFDPQPHAVDVRCEITYDNPKECPGQISRRGQFVLDGRIQSKNGLVANLDNDYDASELL
jgi:Gram-negative bacterial TonB protein C-terminal